MHGQSIEAFSRRANGMTEAEGRYQPVSDWGPPAASGR